MAYLCGFSYNNIIRFRVYPFGLLKGFDQIPRFWCIHLLFWGNGFCNFGVFWGVTPPIFALAHTARQGLFRNTHRRPRYTVICSLFVNFANRKNRHFMRIIRPHSWVSVAGYRQPWAIRSISHAVLLAVRLYSRGYYSILPLTG